LSYRIGFSEAALAKLELLGQSDPKKLRQVFMKTLSLRRTPFPQDSKKLEHFTYHGLAGYRVDQGEYRIIYAVDEAEKVITIGLILNRNEDYKELKKLR
jgi:mRNA interferase RelE/StbE